MDDGGVMEGFEDPGVGGFAGHVGPIYSKQVGDRSIAGFRVEERHCNPAGICHGGWLSTFADVQLVRQIGLALNMGQSGLRTVSLTVDFLSSAMLGQWVEGSAEMIRATRTLAFVQGTARVDDRIIIRMNGIFSLPRPLQD